MTDPRHRDRAVDALAITRDSLATARRRRHGGPVTPECRHLPIS